MQLRIYPSLLSPRFRLGNPIKPVAHSFRMAVSQSEIRIETNDDSCDIDAR
jgi:hypothetical protein